MARLFTFISVAATPLFALQLSLSSGLLEEDPYSVLTLTHHQPFKCINTKTKYDPQDRYLCKFSRVPIKQPVSTKNRFFLIDPFVQQDKFFIEITPLHNSYLYPMKTSHSGSHEWVLLGYQGRIPFINTTPPKGLQFDVALDGAPLLGVGSLDISGTPLMNKERTRDVSVYLEIKELYEKGEYEDAAEMIEVEIKKHASQIFMPEILAYKVRLLAKEEDKDSELRDIAKPWVKTFTTHKDLPEMLYLLANAELSLGGTTDGFYYIDILRTDYKKSLYSEKATLLYGDRMVYGGRQPEAKSTYENLYLNTQRVEIASEAAWKLGKILMQEGKTLKGLMLFRKIFNKNPDFFAANIDQAYENAGLMISYNDYALAGDILSYGIRDIDRNDPKHEGYLLDAARWHAKAGEAEKAKKEYEAFLRDYEFATNREQIKREYDELFFDIAESNISARYARYEELLEKYPNEWIADKALYEKAHLLLQEERYDELLPLIDRFGTLKGEGFEKVPEEKSLMLKKSLTQMVKDQRCSVVANLTNRYEIRIDTLYDAKLFECLVTEGEYSEALKVIDKNLETLSGPGSLIWYQRKLMILDRLSDSNAYRVNAIEYKSLLELQNKQLNEDEYMVLLKHLQKLEQYDTVLRFGKEVEMQYPDTLYRGELYAALARAALQTAHSIDTRTYLKRLVNWQQTSQTKTYTPWAEIQLAKAYHEQSALDEAIQILQVLLEKELTNTERSQGLYLQALYLDERGMTDLAQKLFKRCANLLDSGEYGKMCRDVVGMMDSE